MNVDSIMTKDPMTVSRKASLDRAMDLMEEHDIRHLPVTDESGLAGVISDRDVVEATGWLHPRQREVLEAPSECVGEVMHTPVSTVQLFDPVTDALSLLVKRRIGCVPVLDDGQVAGIVTEVDILRTYANACRTGMFDRSGDPPIEKHMTADVVTVDHDASGEEVAEIMRENGVRHLPVVEGERLIGIVSDRDVRRLRGCGGLELTLVREVMTQIPRTARIGERLSSIAAILSDERIGALPVVDGGRLVGIATTLDVMIPCALSLQRL